MKWLERFSKQPWWGKLIGTFLGFIMSGPAGALFGMLVGNFFDKGLQEQANPFYFAYHLEKNEAIKSLFLEALFLCLGHISKADGRVSEKEILFTKNIIQLLRLNYKKQRIAEYYFNMGKAYDFDLNPILKKLGHIAPNYPKLIRLFVDIQFQNAKLDGFSPNKRRILEIILHHFSLRPINQDDFFHQHESDHSSHQSSRKSPFKDSITEAFSLLQIESSASQAEVKKAYRRLMSQNHPDKLIAKGYSAKDIKAATQKTQTISKAYETICQFKGW